MIHKYSGRPLGSFCWPSSGCRPLVPSTARALFMDWTHDNPSPVQKRSVEDMLPSAALVAMAACAVGSNRGYDELVPQHIHVVTEHRPYAGWSTVHSLSSGMVGARQQLSALHCRLAREDYSELFVDQVSSEVVAVTRACPSSRRSVVLVAHTAFHKDHRPSTGLSLEVEGELEEVLIQASMEEVGGAKVVLEKEEIQGLPGWRAVLGQKLVEMKEEDGKVKLDLSFLPPGGVVALAFRPQPLQETALASLQALDCAGLEEASHSLSLLALQYTLFQCSEEGREAGAGAYSVPGWGDLHYCGLAGTVPLLEKMRPGNDLGHPLAANLREGDWLLDYTLARLEARQDTQHLALWLRAAFLSLRALPRYLVPRYFDSIVMEVWRVLRARVFSLLSPFVRQGSDLVQRLALGGVIHTAVVASAPLPPLAGDTLQPAPTLAAGLPHFSTGYMRSWGRDTFISLRGALLLPGRSQEARALLLAYGGTLRHGLVPNLLDGGRKARYNCRDAVWWWLRAVLDYVELVEDGAGILGATVLRLWPSDDAEEGCPPVPQPLHETIHEALTVHLRGLSFRERNAGRAIDEHMKEEGFNNTIGVDPRTGFVFGGHPLNCGTWMDKMGSSAEAGNKGVPSTPRFATAPLSYSSYPGTARQ